MIVDITVMEVRAGREGEFVRTFHDAWKRLGAVKGLSKWRLLRDSGRPTRFVFYGEWKAAEDHQALVKAPGYGALLAAVGPYLEGSPQIALYRDA